MEIVKMEHVTKIYGEGNTRVWALDDVNLTVNKGEIVAVVGASGSGKSTLLHVDGTEKVDYTVYIWYNVSIKYRRCFYDRTTAEIGAKSIHGNI